MKSAIPEIILREPLVPILILGLILFLAWSFLKPDGIETIEVRPEVIQFRENYQTELAGRPLTDEERRQLVESYIDEEALLREAYKRGFGQTDPRVRKRLLSVMRFSLDESIPSPSVAQLQAYYQENRERFRNDESIDFEVISFGPASSKTPADPVAFLQEIRAAKDPYSLGDFLMSGNRRSASELAIVREFGRDFLEQIWNLDAGEWQGPFKSRVGMHYVRLNGRNPVSYPEFEQIENYLRQDWEFTKRRALQQEKIDQLRAGYRIEYPDADE